MNGEVIQRIKPYVPPAVRRVLNHSIRSPARRLAERAVQREVRATMDAAGLSPITDIEPHDVVIVGYPKSGTTWFRLLVAGVVYGVDFGLSPPAFLNQAVPDVHYQPYYRRLHDPMFFKSHELPRPEYRRVVYLVRDGRDVIVSYLHYLRRERAIDRSVGMAELLTRSDLLFPSRWHEHAEAWASNPYRAEMITIRYEDMLADTLGQLRRFCEFAGSGRDRATLASVVERSAFERMQAREQRARATSADGVSRDLFFRRGMAGSHRDEMSAGTLALFLEQAGSTLRRLGYPVEEAAPDEAGTLGR